MATEFLRLGVDPREAVQGSRRFQQAAEGASVAALGLNTAVVRTAVALGGVGAALVGATVSLGRFAQAGGQQLTVQSAFARRVGDSEAAINDLRRATSGLVGDYELMRQANTALTLGSASTIQEFAELAETAQALGRALGLDAAFALESLNTGIARQSRLILDNLGLIVDAQKANEEYARSVGKTVDELTEAEQAEAFRSEAMDQARQKLDEMGEATLNAGDSWTQLTVEIGNSIDEMKRWVAESDAVLGIFEGMRRTITEMRGGPSAGAQGIIEGLGGIESVAALQQRYEMFADMFPSVQQAAGRSIDEIQSSFEELGIKGSDLGHILAAIEERIASLTQTAREAAPAVRDVFEQVRQYDASAASIPGLSQFRGSIFDPSNIRGTRDTGRDRLQLNARGQIGQGLQASYNTWAQGNGPGFTDPQAIAMINGAAKEWEDLGSKTEKAAAAARVAAPLLGDFGGSLASIASGIAQGGVLGIGQAVVTGVGTIVNGLFDSGVEARRAAQEWERALSDFANAWEPISDYERRLREMNETYAGLANQATGNSGWETAFDSVEDVRAFLEVMREAEFSGFNRAQIVADLEALVEAYEKHAAGLERVTEEERVAFGEDLEVRMLRAKGLDEEADALALAIQHERELAEAREQGYNTDYLEQVQAQEKLAQARKDELDAINAVTQALNAPQGLNLALMEYRASLLEGGTGRGGGDVTVTGGTGVGGFEDRVRRTVENFSVTINVQGATNPRETARLVMEELERQAKTGAGDPFNLTER